MILQSERAHTVISELTTQVSSEYRKLLESMIQMQGQIQNRESKGFGKDENGKKIAEGFT